MGANTRLNVKWGPLETRPATEREDVLGNASMVGFVIPQDQGRQLLAQLCADVESAAAAGAGGGRGALRVLLLLMSRSVSQTMVQCSNCTRLWQALALTGTAFDRKDPVMVREQPDHKEMVRAKCTNTSSRT